MKRHHLVVNNDIFVATIVDAINRYSTSFGFGRGISSPSYHISKRAALEHRHQNQNLRYYIIMGAAGSSF
jgi:hypothetical protein